MSKSSKDNIDQRYQEGDQHAHNIHGVPHEIIATEITGELRYLDICLHGVLYESLFLCVTDPMDNYSLADRAKAEEKKEKEEEQARKNKPPPTAAALSHGNQPSRGAIIDEEIENEEREELKRKGKIWGNGFCKIFNTWIQYRHWWTFKVVKASACIIPYSL